MKKNLLLFCTLAASGLAGIKANAQLALEQFDSGMPASWTVINDGHPAACFTVAALNDSLTNHGWILFKPLTNGSVSMFTTSFFTSATDTADRWLITPSFLVNNGNTILKWDDWDYGSGENLQILVSTNAGTTPADFNPVPLWNMAPFAGDFVTHGLYLGDYNGQTIRLAFRDNNHNRGILAIDNVSTTVQANATDMATTAVAPSAGAMDAYVAVGGSKSISAVFKNNGAVPVSNVTAYYQLDNNTPVMESFSISPALQPLQSVEKTFSTPAAITTAGNHSVKVYVAQAGEAVPADDTMSTTLVALDSLVSRMQMFEEFTGASCDPCAAAEPNIDSVCANNASRMNTIRYHVNIPARDLMYNVTQTVVNGRRPYYNANSTPSGYLNGTYVYPGAGFFTSELIGQETTVSPIRITGTASYNAATNTYQVSADIKSFDAFPAGLVAMASLTIDKITYSGNISLESRPQSVFTDVVENLFPSAAGTPLAAFTAGQTQTINSSWKADHPWGDVAGNLTYTATSTGKITIWVENRAKKTVYQSVSVPLSGLQDTPLGISSVKSGNIDFQLYPNPATAQTTVKLNLLRAGTVALRITDIMGREVKTVSTHMNAGPGTIGIPVAGLVNGVYNISVTTNEGNATRRLTVSR
ncbi:T9SS-dependent choice-of-anchor J family protein [Taibaiella helva]|uniref:T9SS-dependent choice-of-anchor J family protein n=1 Tax=Taibaiella helva TaxID=2301235 RepID=UPI000E581A48|nr:choice-of-anchor J domain-containing protein [Taibaiella helva]